MGAYPRHGMYQRPLLSIVRPSPLPGTAPRGRAAREIKYDGWVDHPGYGLTPDRVVSIFRLAEQGYPQQQCDLFDDLRENDASLRNLFEGRGQAVWGKEWGLDADGTEGDSELGAKVLDEALRPLPMVDTLSHQLEFNPTGWACTELDWDVATIGGRRWVVPVWFANVPARRFRIIPETDELRLLTTTQRTEGEALAPGKWWVTRRSAIRVARAGLMRTAAWYALWKRYGTRDWVVFAEKFGIPLPVVKYDTTVEEQGKAVAVEIVENIGNDGGAVMPKEMEIDILKVDRSGDASGTHGGLIEFCNREMAKLINGATLSNDNASGGSSYALGEVHASVRWESVLADAERIQDTFRRHVAEPFMRFNGLVGRAPMLEIQVVRDQSPKDILEAAAKLKNDLGVDVSVSQLRRVTGLRAPLGTSDSAPGKPVAAAPAIGGAG